MPIRIALIDDHQLVRGGLKLLLQSMPEFKVTMEAGNGKEFLEALSHTKTSPDIALLDVTMPIMDGFETSRVLCDMHPKIRIVALSVHDNTEVVNKMIDCGAHAYLLKDSASDTVRETLLQVFEKGYYYTPLVIESMMKERAKGTELKATHSSYLLQKKDLLTARETEFIKQCCSEKTYKEIATAMNVSLRTVDGYRESVFLKLELKSRTGIVLFAIHQKIFVI